jgi:hypothetical protein
MWRIWRILLTRWVDLKSKMGFKEKAIQKAQAALQGGVMQGFFGVWGGRCTFFAIVFSAVGVYGWLVLNRDLTSFALFAGAIQALLVAHSAKEDYFQKQQQNTTVNISVPAANTTPDKPVI